MSPKYLEQYERALFCFCFRMTSSSCSFLSSNARKFTTYGRISLLEMKVKLQVVKIIVSEEKSARKKTDPSR